MGMTLERRREMVWMAIVQRCVMKAPQCLNSKLRTNTEVGNWITQGHNKLFLCLEFVGSGIINLSRSRGHKTGKTYNWKLKAWNLLHSKLNFGLACLLHS